MPREPQRSPTQPMMLDNDAIFFYSTRDPYGAFSNFAAYPLTLKGRIWPTSEHYFQAQKFAGIPHEEEIRLTKSPTIAARGRYTFCRWVDQVESSPNQLPDGS